MTHAGQGTSGHQWGACSFSTSMVNANLIPRDIELEKA